VKECRTESHAPVALRKAPAARREVRVAPVTGGPLTRVYETAGWCYWENIAFFLVVVLALWNEYHLDAKENFKSS
jgi:hypothetical protein